MRISAGLMRTAHPSSRVECGSFLMVGPNGCAGSAAPAGKVSDVARQQWRSTRAALNRSVATTASADARAHPNHRAPVRPGCSAGIRARALLASRPVGRVSARLPPSAPPSTETSPSAPSPSASAAISTLASRGRYASPGTIRSGPPSSSRDVWSRVPLQAHARWGSSATTANAPRHVTSMPGGVRRACSVPRPCPRGPWRAAGRSELTGWQRR